MVGNSTPFWNPDMLHFVTYLSEDAPPKCGQFSAVPPACGVGQLFLGGNSAAYQNASAIVHGQYIHSVLKS